LCPRASHDRRLPLQVLGGKIMVVDAVLAGFETATRPVFFLARSLAALPQVPLHAVDRLLALCPAELRDAEDGAADEATLVLTQRTREVLLGMALLVLESGGVARQQHMHRLLPPLQAALRGLGRLSPEGAIGDASNADFVQALLTLTLGGATGLPFPGAEDSTILLVEELAAQVAREAPAASARALAGAMVAVRECKYAPSPAAAARLFAVVQDLLRLDSSAIDLRAGALELLLRLVRDATASARDSSSTASIDTAAVVEIALAELAGTDQRSAASIGSAVALCAACADDSAELSRRVTTTLLSALGTVMGASPVNEPLLQRVLDALHELCTSVLRTPSSPLVMDSAASSAADTQHAVVRELKGFALTLESRAAAHEACASMLCAILRLGLENVRHEPLPLAAHTTLTELADLIRRATRSADASALTTLVPLLGDVACGIGHPDAAKFACALLVDTFTETSSADGCAELLPVIVEHVTATAVVAMQGEGAGTDELETVAELLTTGYLAAPYPWAQQQQPLVHAIRQALLQLAEAVESKRTRGRWLEQHVLTLFTKLGQLVHSHCLQGGRDALQTLPVALGDFLPVLAAMKSEVSGPDDCASVSKDIIEPNEAYMLLHRDVWFYMVLFRLVDSASWPGHEDWHVAMERIAAGTPVLMVQRDGYLVGKVIEQELEFNTVLRAGKSMSEADIRDLRAPVEKHLPPKLALLINDQPFHNFLFLASLYYLETFRALSGSCEPVFSYIAIIDIVERSVANCVQDVITLVFSFWLEATARCEPTRSRERMLERHLVRLLSYAAHRVPRTAAVSRTLIPPMLARFPQLHWSSKACFELLDLLNGMICDMQARGAEHVAGEVFAFEHSDSSAALLAMTSEQSSAMPQIRDGLLEICRDWISKANRLAPTAMKVILQNYQNTTVGHSGATVAHASLSFAIDVWSGGGNAKQPQGAHSMQVADAAAMHGVGVGSGPAGTVSDSEGSAALYQRQLSSFSNSLVLAAHYIGEVQGMRELHRTQGDLSGAQASTLDEQVKSHLLGRFESLVADLERSRSAGESSARATLEKEIIATVYRSVALLVTSSTSALQLASSPKTLRLLHNLAWAPAGLLTPRALSAATFAWQWLAVVHPPLAAPLISEICAAWIGTIHQRRGLFSGNAGGVGEMPSKAAQKDGLYSPPCSGWLGRAGVCSGGAAQDEPPDAQQRRVLQQEIEAHSVWVTFLQEWANIVQHRSVAQMDSIMKLLLSSLDDPRALSHRRDSFAPRFRLLRLALFVTDARQTRFGMVVGLCNMEASCSLLNERVMDAALCWFEAAQLSEPLPDGRELIESFLKLFTSMSIDVASVDARSALSAACALQRTESSTVPQQQTLDTKLAAVDRVTAFERGMGCLSPAPAWSPSLRHAKSLPARTPTMTPNTASSQRGAATPSTARSFSDGSGIAALRQASEARRAAFEALAPEDFFLTMCNGQDGGAVAQESNRTAYRQYSEVGVEIRGSWLKRQRALLELLLTSELDQWSAHYVVAKGLSRSGEGMKDRSRSLDTRKKLAHAELQQHITSAWQHSPRLAFRVFELLRGAGASRRQQQLLRALLVGDPLAAIGLPEALPYLLTAEAIASEARSLQLLLYWGPCSLPSAVGLLSRVTEPVASLGCSYAVQYAMRTMECFSAERLVFFLPQLVQSLRGDGQAGGPVRAMLCDFLLKTSQLSMLIAHQLIWLLCTESRTEPPEHGKALVGWYVSATLLQRPSRARARSLVYTVLTCACHPLATAAMDSKGKCQGMIRSRP